jgi:lipopolysaccharide export system protein LptA
MKKILKIVIASSIILLTTGRIIAADINIEANKQTIDAEKNLTTFEGNVKVQTDNITVKSPKAFVNMGKEGKAEKVTFVDGANAVQINKASTNTVKAAIIKLSLLTKKVEADGNVESIIVEKGNPSVKITSDKQSFNIDTNIMQADGNVIITYGEITTHSKSAKIKVAEGGNLEKVKLTGNAQIVQNNSKVDGDNLIFNPKTMELTAIGNTYSNSVLKDNTKVFIWGDYQQFEKKSGSLIASGNVKIIYKDYTATGPKATILPSKSTNKPNKIIFLGRSKIKQDTRIVEADRIEITMAPKNFNAEGNVKTKLLNVAGMKKTPQAPGSENKEL